MINFIADISFVLIFAIIIGFIFLLSDKKSLEKKLQSKSEKEKNKTV